MSQPSASSLCCWPDSPLNCCATCLPFPACCSLQVLANLQALLSDLFIPLVAAQPARRAAESAKDEFIQVLLRGLRGFDGPGRQGFDDPGLQYVDELGPQIGCRMHWCRLCARNH